ncbi:RRXRR domain-containing protein [Dapis sp. BLCC M172]|uniref:RRXRR domain-containing protein n=1 Tax=Dapis sp. BLCC M172 TaxID=2975281 RepID=UPI003CF9D773
MIRVPVQNPDGSPAMPTKASRARRWVKQGKATELVNDAGLYYVRLVAEPSGRETQKITVGCDPGKKYAGIAVQSAKFTLYTAHLVLPFDRVKERVGSAVIKQGKIIKNVRGRALQRRVYHFARFVKECMPDIVTMENVPQLQQHQVFEEFITKLKKLKYFVTFYRVNCQDYGIPQTRRRLVFFASQFGNIDLIPPTSDRHNYKTVRDTIYHLEPLKAGQSSKSDPLHQCSKLSALNLRRIRASKPGGTWRDWPEDLIAKCHT